MECTSKELKHQALSTRGVSSCFVQPPPYLDSLLLIGADGRSDEEGQRDESAPMPGSNKTPHGREEITKGLSDMLYKVTAFSACQ